MSTYHISVITDPEDTRLPAVEAAFTAMYAEMATLGPVLPLVDGGATRWAHGVRAGLERFGRLCVATRDDEVIGFAHGQVKLTPEHQGALRVGLISHVYVAPAHRGIGQARALVQQLHDWFAAKEVHSVELQVVQGNTAALAFWHALGYTDELVQLRRR
jgi:ribosomal protein S18 acetylase RimI-like enzyme